MTKVRIWTEQLPVGSKVHIGSVIYEVDRMTKKKAVLKVPEGIMLDTILRQLGVTAQIEINGELFTVDKATVAIEVAPMEEEEWEGAPIQAIAKGATQSSMFDDEPNI